MAPPVVGRQLPEGFAFAPPPLGKFGRDAGAMDGFANAGVFAHYPRAVEGADVGTRF